MSDHPSVSIIVPILNEEGSLKKFYNELKSALSEYPEHEIIFINDGSDDNSNQIIISLAESDICITVIQFFKNYGKSCLEPG